MIFITSRGIARIRFLKQLLGTEVLFYERAVRKEKATAVAGWGLKDSAIKARKLAARLALPYWSLEDGFLRSVGLGVSGEQPLSLVVDDEGIYYDAASRSRLESQILSVADPAAMRRAAELAVRWRQARVSKYNHLREYAGALPENYVLVVDQTYGDAAIRHGLADASTFQLMLDAALAENPDSRIVVKLHPDVLAGKKRGHFDPASLLANERVVVLGEDVHPVRLIEHARAIYVVTSQVGFEGLLWGKRVRTFGMPFYAGWGLTEDHLPAPARRRPVCLEALVHAALVDYPRYVDPETGSSCTPERLIEWIAAQRVQRARFPEKLHALAFSDWKKPIVRDFFQGSQVVFSDSLAEVPESALVICWGMKPFLSSVPWWRFWKKPEKLQMRQGQQAIRIEDGFLRSVGLGADLIRPVSWVLDRRGIYYDATRPSDLEEILQNEVFDEALLQRSRLLLERIVASNLTKYNVGTQGWQRPSSATRVILVPGQVETDASITYGAPVGVCEVRRNMDLLRSVRLENPDAYVVYKPHPDVLAGLRRKGMNEDEARHYCDEVVLHAPMGEILTQVDEVHVLTSLTGFEALLRGKRVVCYGQPFYSGWGLTTDKVPLVRRSRRLGILELVAGVLIRYPTYVSLESGKFTSPEHALDELLRLRSSGGLKLSLWRRAQRLILKCLGGRR